MFVEEVGAFVDYRLCITAEFQPNACVNKYRLAMVTALIIHVFLRSSARQMEGLDPGSEVKLALGVEE